MHAAGGLSIDSPLYTPSTIEGVSPFTGDVVSGNGSMGEDVDMVRLVYFAPLCDFYYSGLRRHHSSSKVKKPL